MFSPDIFQQSPKSKDCMISQPLQKQSIPSGNYGIVLVSLLLTLNIFHTLF